MTVIIIVSGGSVLLGFALGRWSARKGAAGK